MLSIILSACNPATPTVAPTAARIATSAPAPPQAAQTSAPTSSPTLSPAAQTLLDQARAAYPKRYQFALDQGARIAPTDDGKSFYLLWYPENFGAAAPRALIVALHGHASWAFDEFFLWQPHAAPRGYGILAVQWWLGGGEKGSDYYAPQELYPLVERVLRQERIRPGKSLLHGFSRGSANIYAVTLFDRITRNNFFGLTLADAGGAAPDFPLNLEITRGVFGNDIFAGTHWALFCGGRDPNPEQDGCPAMRRTRDWVTQYGGVVDLFIEDANAGHGGFHQTPAHVNAALDVFARLLATR